MGNAAAWGLDFGDEAKWGRLVCGCQDSLGHVASGMTERDLVARVRKISALVFRRNTSCEALDDGRVRFYVQSAGGGVVADWPGFRSHLDHVVSVAIDRHESVTEAVEQLLISEWDELLKPAVSEHVVTYVPKGYRGDVSGGGWVCKHGLYVLARMVMQRERLESLTDVTFSLEKPEHDRFLFVPPVYASRFVKETKDA